MGMDDGLLVGSSVNAGVGVGTRAGVCVFR